MELRTKRLVVALFFATGFWGSMDSVRAQGASLESSSTTTLRFRWPQGYFQDMGLVGDRIGQGFFRVFSEWQSESGSFIQFEPFVMLPPADDRPLGRGSVQGMGPQLSRPRTGQFTVGLVGLRPRCFFHPDSWRERARRMGSDRYQHQVVLAHFLPVWWVRAGYGYSGEPTINFEVAQRYFVNYQVDSAAVIQSPADGGRVQVLTRQQGEALDVFRQITSAPLPLCGPDEANPQLSLEKLRAALQVELSH